MGYSYDQHRPVLIDSARMDLDDQSDALRAMAETVPATLNDQPDHPWLGSVAAASQAPRIPRATRQQGVPHCTGSCQQGRAPCSTPGDCLTARLSPIDESREYGRLWWGVMTIISVVAVAFALAGCGGGDASASEVAEHDQQAIQPVSCSASGCAR